MKVAFIPTYVSGVIFYRVWQPYLELRKSKRDQYTVTWYKPTHLNMHPWEWDLYEQDKFQGTYLSVDAACRWADIVVWMGLHTGKSLDLFVHMRAKHGKPFVTEVDDFIFSIPPKNAAFGFYRPGTEFTRISLEQIKRSDALVVSTPHLAELYKPFNSNISVIENTVDLSLWRKAGVSSQRQRQGVTIGWMGGGTHNDDHEMIKDAVFEVLEKRSQISFHYISGCPCPEFFKGHKRIKWENSFKSIDKYPQWITKKGFDIGIAPLVDNEFNRGKSNLRWLEFSAMGNPIVASPVNHFKSSIKHGKTGYLASTKDEWVKYLLDLVDNKELRETMGNASREEVKTNWNPKVQAKKYSGFLKEMTNAITNEKQFSFAG